MSLGLARDSFLDLTELAKDKQQRGVRHHSKSSSVDAGNDIVFFSPSSTQGINSTTEYLLAVDKTTSDSLGYEYYDTDSDSDDDVVGMEDDFARHALSENEIPAYGTDIETYYDPYSVSGVVNRRSTVSGNVFCCLFAPWAGNRDNGKEAYSADYVLSPGGSEDGNVHDGLRQISSSGGDEVRDNQHRESSNALNHHTGEDPLNANCKENESFGRSEEKDITNLISNAKGRNVEESATRDPQRSPSKEVLQRLLNETMVTVQRMHSEGSTQAQTAAHTGGRESLKLTKEFSERAAPSRGILRRGMQNLTSKDKMKKAAEEDSRRSLFPTMNYDIVGSSGRNISSKKVRYNSMAKVMPVTSRKDMSVIERAMVWWTRTEYDEFKKTGRIITKAMLEGGSEIWLASQHAKHPRSNQQQIDHGHKWWCKFGHSRRGLEHIASVEEGKLRQKSVQNSIKAVIKEQQKQKLTKQNDPQKISSVSQQFTRWAKQLALAAGKADAEAVETDFKEKTTESSHVRARVASKSVYDLSLLKSLETHGDIDEMPLTPDVLDAYTASSIYARRKNERVQLGKVSKDKMTPQTSKGETETNYVSAATAVNVDKESLPAVVSNGITVEQQSLMKETELYEAIHDPMEHNSRMAKKAAGFGHGEDEIDFRLLLGKDGRRVDTPVGISAH